MQFYTFCVCLNFQNVLFFHFTLSTSVQSHLDAAEMNLKERLIETPHHAEIASVCARSELGVTIN